MTANMHSRSNSTSHTGDEGNAADFTLPDDYAMLVALRAAIDTKIATMQSTGVAALREKYAQEAAALGVTPEDVLGITSKKPRGRKAKPKPE